MPAIGGFQARIETPLGTTVTAGSYKTPAADLPTVSVEGAYVRLVRDVTTGTLIDRPQTTVKRYITHPVGTTTLALSSPADMSAISSSPVTVTGTTVAGNHVYAAATNTDSNSATTTASTTAASDGSFSLNLVVTSGTSVINVVAVSPSGATAHAQRSVVWDFTPGTVLLDVTDPSNDDTGPATTPIRRRTTSTGAFDITGFKVILSPDTLTTTFKLQTRDRRRRVGSPLGAQMVDVSAARRFGDLDRGDSPNGATPLRWLAMKPILRFTSSAIAIVDANGRRRTIGISANAISRTSPSAAHGQPRRYADAGRGLQRGATPEGRIFATEAVTTFRQRPGFPVRRGVTGSIARTARSIRARAKAIDAIAPGGRQARGWTTRSAGVLAGTWDPVAIVCVGARAAMVVPRASRSPSSGSDRAAAGERPLSRVLARDTDGRGLLLPGRRSFRWQRKSSTASCGR